MPDPGFCWYERHIKETVSRLPAACLIEEAARLLQSAALLWPGRVRAKELREISAALRERGKNWRHGAVCLTDHPWTNGLDSMKSAGGLLGDFRFTGNMTEPKELPGHSAEAARIFVRAAFTLTYRAVPMVRSSGGSHRDREADGLEDLLELPEEAPYAVGTTGLIAESGLERLVSRSAAVFNSGLAASLEMLYVYKGGILSKTRPPERRVAIDRWSAVSKHWQDRAEMDFRAFIDSTVSDVETARRLLGAVGRPSLYVEFSRDHYTDDETMARTEMVARALTSALWRALGQTEPMDLAVPPALQSAGG